MERKIVNINIFLMILIALTGTAQAQDVGCGTCGGPGQHDLTETLIVNDLSTNGFNNVNNPIRFNLMGGEQNTLESTNDPTEASLIYGSDNEIDGTLHGFALGVQNTVEDDEIKFALGDTITLTGGNGTAEQFAIGGNINLAFQQNFGIGRDIKTQNDREMVIGFGTSSNKLKGIGSNTLTLGMGGNNMLNLIGSSSNVGIGTDNPFAKFTIESDGSSSSGAAFSVLNNNSTSLMSIANNGNVGIGTSSPQNTTDISGNAVIGSGFAGNNAAPTDGLLVDGNVGFNTTSITSGFTFENNGDAIGSSWQTFSDKRFKKDLKVIENPIEKLLKIKGLTFDFKNNKFPKRNFGNDREAGVIAQDIKEVLPEIVEKTDKGYYTVDYDGIIPLLIETNKSQQEEIDRLKDKAQKVEKLEQQVEELQQQMQELINQPQNGANRFQNSNEDNLNQKTVSIDASDNSNQAMLLQNRPNPHKGETVIPFYLPRDFESADLLILTPNGQMIKRISLDKAGKGELTLRTRDLKAGQYLYSLVVDGRKIQTRKMMIQR